MKKKDYYVFLWWINVVVNQLRFKNWKFLIEFPGNKVITIEKNVTKPWLICTVVVFNAFKNFCLKIDFTEIA